MKEIFIIFILILDYSFATAQHWQQYGNGIFWGSTFMVDSIQNKLYLIGKYVDQNNDTIISPGYWNGNSWNSIGNFDFSNTGIPYKLFMYDSTIYLGGGFEKVTGAPGNYILKLNSSNDWDSLEFSPDNLGVHSFGEYQGRLYIGGRFKYFGPLSSIGVVIHNPPYWSTIPPFTHFPWIESMIEYNYKLVIAGVFASDLTNNYKGNIVEYDGVNILPMVDGIDNDDPYSLIIDMEVYNNKLFVAGNIHAHNIANGLNIVCWDGQTWSDVGGGVNNDIYDLQVYNGELYAAGLFTMAGNIPADHIAKWDGHKWCSLGSNFNGNIIDMCVFNNELIVTGSFTQIDGQPVSHIAKWVGGNYSDSCQVVGIDNLNINHSISLHPSPVIENLKIKSSANRIIKAGVFDITGKLLICKSINNYSYNFNVSELGSGVYLVIIETTEGRIVKKFIKE